MGADFRADSSPHSLHTNHSKRYAGFMGLSTLQVYEAVSCPPIRRCPHGLPALCTSEVCVPEGEQSTEILNMVSESELAELVQLGHDM